ncbi:MAG: hypothetical protein ABJD53_18675 [Gammaproteobacteria bacterium]
MENCAAAAVELKGLLQADVPGRAFTAAAGDNCGKIDWYPTVADLALSADLGFTAGPWVCTLAGDGRQIHGHFLAIWKRDAGCGWQLLSDRSVSHPPPENLEPRLVVDPEPPTRVDLPPKLLADEAASRAIADFQGAVREDGLAAGLRTYARTGDFRFYTDHEAPMGLADANVYFTHHSNLGVSREDSRVLSADGSLAYCAGKFTEMKQGSSHDYAQIWQYEPRVANWGLRILLINAL